jgi:hypothetical protein
MILGLLTTLAGVYKLHLSVKPDKTSEVTFHTKKPHEAGIIDFYRAREGLRYTIYGFLIQAMTILL